jgi:hypothetical protein
VCACWRKKKTNRECSKTEFYTGNSRLFPATFNKFYFVLSSLCLFISDSTFTPLSLSPSCAETCFGRAPARFCLGNSFYPSVREVAVAYGAPSNWIKAYNGTMHRLCSCVVAPCNVIVVSQPFGGTFSILPQDRPRLSYNYNSLLTRRMFPTHKFDMMWPQHRCLFLPDTW